jgi:uncharacterized Tic20 family protein
MYEACDARYIIVGLHIILWGLFLACNTEFESRTVHTIRAYIILCFTVRLSLVNKMSVEVKQK